jgi:serpin B
MTHAGSRGTTAVQIAEVLGMPNDPSTIAGAAESLEKSLKDSENPALQINLANRLWLQKNKSISSEFSTLLEKKFSAPLGMIDFAGQPESARVAINTWASQETNKKIENLLQPGDITALTRIVLTNAVYFNAAWESHFAIHETQNRQFNLSSTKKVQAAFMHKKTQLTAGTVGIGRKAAFVVELPYAGSQFNMVLIVPKEIEGLASVLNGLSGDWWSKAIEENKQAEHQVVDLYMPRWTTRQHLLLKKTLQSLGVLDAFDTSKADFSAIDGTRDLVLSNIIHEGFVEVSERGTEAAAATAATIVTRGAMQFNKEPLKIDANRPFAWAIMDRKSGAMLFNGIVRDPR